MLERREGEQPIGQEVQPIVLATINIILSSCNRLKNTVVKHVYNSNNKLVYIHLKLKLITQ